MNLKSIPLGVLLCMSLGHVQAAELKTIRFGTEASYAPFESKSPSGELIGFDIDLGNALCAELKAKCEWVESSFDGLIPALQSKKFDVISAAMNITEKRLKNIDFTVPLYVAPTRLVARTGSQLLPDANALKGKRIGVLQGSVQENYAKTVWSPAGVEVVSYQDQNLVYSDLANGRLEGTLVDAISASDAFLKKPAGKGFAFAGPRLQNPAIFGVGVGLGVRKGDASLKNALNTAFARLKSNGTYDRLMKKYFDFDISAD
ncbi:ABC transporter substrate-binding protein [Leeia oryzae]|uniref:ABC transporter substrate-binding protein n=1 Tax=Leeia oryzae TaxID=356662 RepID=UPI000363C64C|nr:ABC transporter substrate-binding protein [Leeia oryzae]